MLETTLTIIAWAIAVIALLPIGYTFALALAGCYRQPQAKSAPEKQKLAIIIPAHNEALLIQDTIKHALAQEYPPSRFAVFVIADNCSDNTAELASQAGAHVWTRTDNPGKGQALEFAFDTLLKDDWQGFLVIDADSHLSTNALDALNNEFSSGAPVLQLFDTINNPNDSMRTLAMQLGMASFNGLRPCGRTALGLSAGLFGNGFALSRKTIEACPYKAHSIVEDLEYHMLLLQNHYRVKLVEYASAAAQMPKTADASSSQRQRWELGRIAMIKHYAGDLFFQTLKGNKWALEALIDIVMPPASLMVILAVTPSLIGSGLVQWLGLMLVMMLFIHYFIASIRFGSFIGFCKVACYVPWYIIWKTWLVLRTMGKGKNLPWIRTRRHK